MSTSSDLDDLLGSITPGSIGQSNGASSVFGAADNHNIANGQFAFTDPNTWGQGLSNAGKFIVASAYSGINSFYNTGVAIGNAFGADASYNDTAQGLADIDNDLGAYYQQNKKWIDVAGLFAGSFIPGMAGVKLLNIGQKTLSTAVRTGIFGENFAKVSGLLAPDAAVSYATRAGQEMAVTQASFTTLNGNIVKSLAAGYTQNVLENAAFQVATTAAMFKSPVLDDSDASAITKDIITTSFAFGVFGAAIGAAKNYGVVKQIVKAGDVTEKPYSTIHGMPEAMSTSDKIIGHSYQLDALPQVPEIAADAGEFEQKQFTKLTRIRSGTFDRLNNMVRTGIRSLAGSDNEFGNQVADVFNGLPASEIDANLTGVEQFGRLSSKLSAEKDISIATKKGFLDYADSASINKSIQYIKLLGEDSGSILSDPPATPNLADTLPNAAAIKEKIASFDFSTNRIWNPISTPAGVNHLEAEARYSWASGKGISIKDGMKVGEHDIPLQERIYRDWNSQLTSGQPLDQIGKLSKISIITKDGSSYQVTNPDDLLRGIRQSKQEIANYLQASRAAGNSEITLDQIAKTANVRKSWLLGERLDNEARDIFAKQSFDADYNQMLASKGLSPKTGPVDTTFLPTYLKASIDHSSLMQVDGNLINGLARIQAIGKLVQQDVINVTSKFLGDRFNSLPAITNDQILQANRFGVRPSILGASNSDYLSIGSAAEQIGHVTADTMTHWIKSNTSELEAPLIRMAQNQDAVTEYAAIKKKVQETAEIYTLSDDGGSLVHRDYKNWQAAKAAGNKDVKPPEIQAGAPLSIPIVNKEVQDVIAAMQRQNGRIVTAQKELLAAQGHVSNKDPDAIYFERPNLKDYPHFAMVEDQSVTAGTAGQKSMLHAATPEKLEAMIDAISDPVRYRIYTKAQTEEYFKARGDFDYQQTLNETTLDSNLKKMGINNEFFLKTDPQKVINDIMEAHNQRSTSLVREMVAANYAPQFETLKNLGDQYTGVATSKYGNLSLSQYADKVVNNPYTSVIKTALNLKQTAEYPLWTGFNNILDAAVSRATAAVQDAFSSITHPNQLEAVNQQLQRYGIKTGFEEAATMALANHSAPKGALQSFIRSANSILSTLTVGMNPISALNRAVGHTVMFLPETANLLRSLSESGHLDATSTIPGTVDSVLTPAKLVANAEKNYFTTGRAQIADPTDFYVRNGWVHQDVHEMRNIGENLALEGGEGITQLNAKITQAFAAAKKISNAGYKLSGNLMADQRNRWMVANVADQITDAAIAAGKMDPDQKVAVINTFVNRTNGNYLASQRPIAFQGPVGQAVGLYQTYQFNMMQQLFRYVQEGSVKDSAMLLGMQSTLYGMTGLPAFNFINQHILGTLSSNPKHTDAYDATYGTAGKTIGDWLLYGAPSNLLGTNLYTHGDLNPRQPTLLPTDPSDIPIINATASFFSNLKQMASKMNDGGSVWESFLQGIEHNGLSRPLSGLAQIAQATVTGRPMATSKDGTILGSNDMFSLASLSRLAGGRPLEESVAMDAAYRMNAYKAVDTERKKVLDQAVKSSVIAGTTPSDQQTAEFAARYAALGGDTKRFNQYMLKQITDANTPMAEKIMKQLRSPYAQNMQMIMGGKSLFDQ